MFATSSNHSAMWHADSAGGDAVDIVLEHLPAELHDAVRARKSDFPHHCGIDIIVSLLNGLPAPTLAWEPIPVGREVAVILNVASPIPPNTIFGWAKTAYDIVRMSVPCGTRRYRIAYRTGRTKLDDDREAAESALRQALPLWAHIIVSGLVDELAGELWELSEHATPLEAERGRRPYVIRKPTGPTYTRSLAAARLNRGVAAVTGVSISVARYTECRPLTALATRIAAAEQADLAIAVERTRSRLLSVTADEVRRYARDHMGLHTDPRDGIPGEALQAASAVSGLALVAGIAIPSQPAGYVDALRADLEISEHSQRLLKEFGSISK